jgi:hypothetical protein
VGKWHRSSRLGLAPSFLTCAHHTSRGEVKLKETIIAGGNPICLCLLGRPIHLPCSLVGLNPFIYDYGRFRRSDPTSTTWSIPLLGHHAKVQHHVKVEHRDEGTHLSPPSSSGGWIHKASSSSRGKIKIGPPLLHWPAPLGILLLVRQDDGANRPCLL